MHSSILPNIISSSGGAYHAKAFQAACRSNPCKHNSTNNNHHCSRQVAAQGCSNETGAGATGPADVTRRHLLLGATSLSCLTLAASCPPVDAKPAAGEWSSPGLATPEDDTAPRFFKLGDGVKIQELVAGTGPAARQGDYVTLNYVLRRPNGYFIYATVEGVSFQPRDVPTGPVTYRLGDDNVITGFQEVLEGMQAGGKRRALIPPGVGYVDINMEPQPPTFSTKRQLVNHAAEPLLFEVQVLKVRPGPASSVN